MSFEPANLFTCDSNYYLIYLLQSIHAETPHVGAVNTRRFNSGYTCSNLIHPYFIGGTAHWLNRHRDSLEVTQDFPLNTDQEYYSHCWRKIRALYAKVHLNLEKSTTVMITDFGYKLATELTTCIFTRGISIIEQTSIVFARTKFQFHYDI